MATPLSYKEQLLHPKWRERRLQILMRDSYTCNKCPNNGENSQLDVHHKYYLMGKMAWEYDDIVLETLCTKCHKIEGELIEYQSKRIIEIFKQSGASSGQLSELAYYLVCIFDCERVIEILHSSVQEGYRKDHPVEVQSLFGDIQINGQTTEK